MSKKITIANPEVLSNGISDSLRDYLYKWSVANGQLNYILNQNNDDLLIVTRLPNSFGDVGSLQMGETPIKENLFGTTFGFDESSSREEPIVMGVSTPGGEFAFHRSFGTRTEKIIIRSKKLQSSVGGVDQTVADIATIEEFQDLVNNLVLSGSTTKSYADFVTVATTQPIIEETLNSQFDNPADQQGVSFHYNYFDREYEEELTNVTEHYFIPNIYETVDIQDERDSENLFKTPIVEKLRANLLDSATSLSTQNQIVPSENNSEFTNASGYSSYFPMTAEIVVSSGQGSRSDIAQTFFEAVQGVNFTRDLENVTPPSIASTVLRENITISTDYVNEDGQSVLISDDIDNVKTVNLAAWVDQDAPGWAGSTPFPVPDNFSFIGPPTMATEQTEYPNETQTAMQVALFYERMKDIADIHRRRFYQILSGEPAYSETLMYKIEKFLGPIDSITTSDPIQSFHFMNLGDLTDFYLDQLAEDQQRKHKFIDTQVKYGQDYSYVVTAYQAIVGTHYKYDTSTLNFNIPPAPYTQPLQAEVDVNLETVIKVVEVPLYATSGKVLDLPPLPPEVDFKPIQGSADKIRISLDMSLGSQDLQPISLNSQEQTTFEQMAVNQGRSDGLLTFGSDNAPSAYEVFKLDSPPVKIEDFDGNRVASVSTLSSDGKTKRQASSATYIARQPINQKCYYMFRSIDYHGGLSNPSTVYEIELYGDNGVTFPIVREYQFGQISPKMDSKPARKIIQIVPRFTQAYLNEEASGLIDPATGEIKPAMGSRVYLGVEDDPLFGRGDKPRKFKIRITSKTTGKKVDLNVSFKTKEVKAQTQ